VRAIGQDEALVQELAERRFLVNATPENLELLLSEALLAMLAFPPADRDTQLTKKVLSQSGFLDIKYTGDNAEELWRSISAAFGEKMEKWKKDHPEDIEFAEELWKEMSASRLLPSEF
jgi:hypothetical protein